MPPCKEGGFLLRPLLREGLASTSFVGGDELPTDEARGAVEKEDKTIADMTKVFTISIGFGKG